MVSQDRPTQAIATQVASVMAQAEERADRIRQEAEQRASHAVSEASVEIRGQLEKRIERLRAIRAEVNGRRREIEGRLRQVAQHVARLPDSALADIKEGEPSSNSFERAQVNADDVSDGLEPHLATIVRTAAAVASDVVESARARAAEIEQAAQEEAKRIATERPARFAQRCASASGEAKGIVKQVDQLGSLLGERRAVLDDAEED